MNILKKPAFLRVFSKYGFIDYGNCGDIGLDSRLTESEKFLRKEKSRYFDVKKRPRCDQYRSFVPRGSYPRDSRKSLQSSIGCPERPVIQNFKALSSGLSIKERPASLSMLSTVSISRSKPTPMATIASR